MSNTVKGFKSSFCPIMQANEKYGRADCSSSCSWYDPKSGKCAVLILAKASQKQSNIVQGEIDRRLNPRIRKDVYQPPLKEKP